MGDNFSENFFIPEKGYTFAAEVRIPSLFNTGILFHEGTYWRISVIYFFVLVK